MHTPYGWSSAASRACRLSLALSKLLGGWPGEAMMVLGCSGFLGAVRVVLRVVRVVQGPLVAPGGSEFHRGSPRIPWVAKGPSREVGYALLRFLGARGSAPSLRQGSWLFSHR